MRARRLGGFKFKSQHTLGPFVADFCCWERRLVVEIDGGQHTEESDRARTEWLERKGYRVIRFWNNDVLTNLDGVLQTILEALSSNPHPGPHRVNIAPRCLGHAGGMTDPMSPQAGEGE